MKKDAGAVVDEVKKGVAAVKEDVAGAEEKIEKLVHSIVGPITKINPPGAGSNPASASLMGLFGPSAEPASVADDTARVRIFVATIDDGTATPVEGKLAKKTPVVFQWEVTSTLPESQVEVGIIQLEEHWYGNHWKPLMAPVHTLKGAFSAKVFEDTQYKLVANKTGAKAGDSHTLKLEIDEAKEFGGASIEAEVDLKLDVLSWKHEQDTTYFHISYKAHVELGVHVKFSVKKASLTRANIEHALGALIRKREGSISGRLRVQKYEPEGKAGFEFKKAGIKFGEKDKNGKREGLGIDVVVVKYKLRLPENVELELSGQILSLEKEAGEWKKEIKGPGVGGEVSWPCDLSIYEAELRDLGVEATIEPGFHLKLVAAVEVEPNYKAILKNLLEDVATDALIDAFITVAFVAGGILEIGGFVYVLSRTGDWFLISPKIHAYTRYFTNGFLFGVSGNDGKFKGEEGAEKDDKEAYEKGNSAGQNRRFLAMREAQKNAGESLKVTDALLNQWFESHVQEIRAEADSRSIRAAQEAVWDSYGADHKDNWFDSHASGARVRAFDQIFNWGKASGMAKDNGLPTLSAGEYKTKWEKYVTSSTPDAYKTWPIKTF